MTFSDYLEEQEMRSGMPKPWKARRKDVLTFWGGLQSNMPLQPSPISKHHTGTRFREDGLRITGSSFFVNSVMSHLKDFLRFDTDPRTKLDVEYRQIQGKEGDPTDVPIYVCYVYVLKNEKEIDKVLGGPEAPKPPKTPKAPSMPKF